MSEMRRWIVWMLPLVAACYAHRLVERADWPVLTGRDQLRVRTFSGTERTFDRFVFTTSGLSGWRVGRDTLTRVDSTFVPLDSIAMVRVSEFSRSGTLVATAAATSAAFVLLSLTKSGNRPVAVPRPAGSCPFAYSFDGKDYILDSETYAGAISSAFERTDVDNLEHIRAIGGRYIVRLRNERPESEYTDELSLLAVDHARGTRVFPDVSGVLHVVGESSAAATETAFGGDSLPTRAGRELTFATRPDSSALILRVRNTEVAPFVLEHVLGLLGSDVYSWYAALRSQYIQRAIVQSWMDKEGALDVRVATREGWRTVGRVPDVGPSVAKTIVIPLPRVTGDSMHVRLESSPGLWYIDSVTIASYHGKTEARALALLGAADESGRTVTSLLVARDRRYLVALRGSDVRAEFAAPAVAPGMTRSVMLRTTGHYYIDTQDSTPPRLDVVQRLMSDRAFAQRYWADAWMRERGESILQLR
ncbi:MAG TPA: hypothetical protein VJ867_04865 [Gemmatimonadaceae bacterium]|nr:hypothetical protein [Gemmatimonadaceae bacterium]